jgi:uncharacterized protein YccT (UPF0319 family)
MNATNMSGFSKRERVTSPHLKWEGQCDHGLAKYNNHVQQTSISYVGIVSNKREVAGLFQTETTQFGMNKNEVLHMEGNMVHMRYWCLRFNHRSSYIKVNSGAAD